MHFPGSDITISLVAVPDARQRGGRIWEVVDGPYNSEECLHLYSQAQEKTGRGFRDPRF